MTDKRLLLVGLGLMGTSLLKALREAYSLHALGTDVYGPSVEKALNDHLIEDGANLQTEPNKAHSLVQKSNIIILAMYPEGILPFIREYQKDLMPGTLVLDICGLKGDLVHEAQSLMPEGVEYLGTHPMSGKEKAGYDYADPEMFLGGSFLITPTEKNKPETVEMVRQAAFAIGSGRVKLISPEDHDQMIAYTSQLPHVMAISLIQSWKGDTSIADYTGGSFRDATRVAEINTALWSELLIDNRKELLASMEAYEEEIRIIKQFLLNNDQKGLAAYLEEARQRKQSLQQRKDQVERERT